jgi:hypothetical protein
MKLDNSFIIRTSIIRTFSIYYSSDQSKYNEMDGTSSVHGEKRNAYETFVGKLEARRRLRRSSRRWGSNHRWGSSLKLDLKEMTYEGLNRIQISQVSDQWRNLMNTMMTLLLHKSEVFLGKNTIDCLLKKDYAAQYVRLISNYSCPNCSFCVACRITPTVT